ncbi:hypothetical protein DL96DRAFT_1761097 [Flagelloscypha sp. PMI_526]|nr:hypothetical protein DL96DRAFT_1761097 [Flagelloscypha sp. PMI_526]
MVGFVTDASMPSISLVRKLQVSQNDRLAVHGRIPATHHPLLWPAGHSGFSNMVVPGHDIPQGQANSQFPAPPVSVSANPSRRSRSHSCSQSERVALPMIHNPPPMSSIPLQTVRKQKAARIPSAIPSSYAEDTIFRQPQFEPAPQYSSPPTRKALGQNAPQTPDRLLPHPQFPFTVDGPRPETAGLSGPSAPLPRPNIIHEPLTSLDDGHRRSRSRQPVVPPPGFPGPVVNWRDIPRKQINFPFATVPMPPSPEPHRRSRSHSRSRSERDVPSPDPEAPPVPFIQSRPRRQQKPAPVPSVIPPGYPEGTVWVVDPPKWPRLETPAQRAARYGTHSSPVLQASQNYQQDPQASSRYPQTRVQSHTIIQPQPSAAPQNLLDSPQIPVTAPSAPQKPFLKRMFGGIIGGKETRTPGPTQPPPAGSAPSPFQPLSRTKSMG